MHKEIQKQEDGSITVPIDTLANPYLVNKEWHDLTYSWYL